MQATPLSYRDLIYQQRVSMQKITLILNSIIDIEFMNLETWLTHSIYDPTLSQD